MKIPFSGFLKFSLLLAVWAMPLFDLFAQVKPLYGTVNGTQIKPDSLPQYPGGDAEMFKFIGRHLRYPASAVEDGVEGKVFISYILDEEGNLTEAQIETSVRSDLDKEALRVISLLNGWKPAYANGQPVKYRHVMPVKFKLQ